MRLPRKQLHVKRTGAAMIEFAGVLTLFVLFFFGVLEFGRYIMAKHLVDHAAREGARWAAVNVSEGTDQQLVNRVKQALLLQDKNGNLKYSHLHNPVIDAYLTSATTGSDLGAWQDAAFGDPIMVHVTVEYHPILPNLLGIDSGSVIQLQSRSMMRSEYH